MPISDIPGYIQGFRFSDESASYYDSTAKVFHDLAGYGAFNALEITVGTPSFTTDGGQRGLLLDNTCQGRFLPAIPWQGACITVMKPVTYDATTKTLTPVVFGKASSLSSNAYIALAYASSVYNHRLASTSAQILATNAYSGAGNSGVKVGAFAISQQTRKGYSTKDGVTVAETSAVADGGSGVALDGKNTARTDAQFARFGNISGTLDDTAALATTHKALMFELHFFKGNPLITDAATVASVLAELKAQYGEA
jgi:hypothetical protein